MCRLEGSVTGILVKPYCYLLVGMHTCAVAMTEAECVTCCENSCMLAKELACFQGRVR